MRETWQELIVVFGELAAICLNCDMRFKLINIQRVVYMCMHCDVEGRRGGRTVEYHLMHTC
jgi:hypothetical protein